MSRALAAIWTTHRWLGLACALLFLATALTGILLMFQRELGLTGAARLPFAATSLAGLDAALAETSARHPDYVPVFLSAAPDRSHAWQLVSNPKSGNADLSQISSIDPSSGRVLSRIEVRHAAATVLFKIHSELLGGTIGHLVVLAMSVGVLALSVSGFLISQRRWRTITSNPWQAPDRWRAVHRWGGLVGALLLLMWGTTGFLMLGRIVLQDWEPAGLPMPVESLSVQLPLQDILQQASARSAGEIFGIGLPTSASPWVEVTLLRRNAGPWAKFQRLRFDRLTGSLIVPPRPQPQSFADAVFAVADSIHKGQSDPPLIHFLYLIAVGFPVLIAVSGPGTWLRRRLRLRR
jgi:uncharacterized iron-regulated membrane protein